MDHKDWDPDDFLDFQYGHPVKEQEKYSTEPSDDMKLYAEMRKNRQQAAQPSAADAASAKSAKSARNSRKSGSAAKSGASAKAANSQAPQRRTPEEIAALQQAQEDAYNRYRSNYSKSNKKKQKKQKKAVQTNGKYGKKAGIMSRLLADIYVIAMVIFLGALTVMDVLPFKWLVALYAVVLLLGLIIVLQLRSRNIKLWARTLATFTAIALIIVYGVGATYAMNTMQFLNFTSVENSNRVASISKQPFNVCITGIDVKGKIDEEGRSDVNMIVTVNPTTAEILLTSIPRDYQIYMPDKDNAMDKLTHTGFYGVDTTIQAEQQLLDIDINYFVKVNFSTVTKFIDAIGGIDVYSEYEFVPVKMKDWTVQEGWNHMNGKQALAFARERKAFPTGDNQRIKNQQAVFEAMIKKATSSTTMMLSYNKVLTSLKDYYRMSISSAEMRSLIKLQLAKEPDWKIYKNTIVGGDGSLPTYSTGNAYAYVMLQDESSIDNAKTLINAVLDGKQLKTNDDGEVKVVKEKSEEEKTEGDN